MSDDSTHHIIGSAVHQLSNNDNVGNQQCWELTSRSNKDNARNQRQRSGIHSAQRRTALETRQKLSKAQEHLKSAILNTKTFEKTPTKNQNQFHSNECLDSD